MPHIFCPNTHCTERDYTEMKPSTVSTAKAKPARTAAERHSEVHEVSCGMQAEIDQMLSSGVQRQEVLCPVTGKKTPWKGWAVGVQSSLKQENKLPTQCTPSY